MRAGAPLLPAVSEPSARRRPGTVPRRWLCHCVVMPSPTGLAAGVARSDVKQSGLPARKAAAFTARDKAATPAADRGLPLLPGGVRPRFLQSKRGPAKASCPATARAAGPCGLLSQWRRPPRCWRAVWGRGRPGLPMVGVLAFLPPVPPASPAAHPEATRAAPRATSTHLRPEERQVGLSPALGHGGLRNSAVGSCAYGSSPKT